MVESAKHLPIADSTPIAPELMPDLFNSAIEDDNERFNEETKQAMRDVLEGKNLVGPFRTFEEWKAHMESDDE